jgi:hypothetical protein
VHEHRSIEEMDAQQVAWRRVGATVAADAADDGAARQRNAT